MKVQESVNCDLCLSLLRSSSLEKTNALLELIYNQDRGRLNYPNEKFVALIIYAIQIMVKILPNLPTNKVDFILKNVLYPTFVITQFFNASVILSWYVTL
jgi:hypothetical protein